MGLRAGEVAGLRLDDIDWRRGRSLSPARATAATSSPAGRCGRGCRGLAAAGRPATALDRSVFIRIKAPHRGLTSGGDTQAVAAAGSGPGSA